MTKADPVTDVSSILAGLIAERGLVLLDDRRKILGLLRDRASTEVRTIRLLMTAFDEGVAHRFRSGSISGMDVDREATRLNVNAGITAVLAREAVLAWAKAAGKYDGANDSTTPALIEPVAKPDAIPPAALLPAETADFIGQPALPPVRPLPPVQPLPSVQPLPGAQPLPGSKPPVQPLPSNDYAAAPQPSSSAPAADPQPAVATDKWKWLRIAAGAIIVLGGMSRIVGSFNHTPAQAPVAEQPQPAQPAQPSPPPAQAQPGPALTPEGVPVIGLTDTGPTFPSERFNNKPNSILFRFGVLVGDQAVTYAAAFIFDGSKPVGSGLIFAFRGSQQATTGLIAADHYTTDNKLIIRVFGKMTSNPIGAPPLCVVLNVAPRYDIVDVAAYGMFSVFGLDAQGNCDGNAVYGNGVVH